MRDTSEALNNAEKVLAIAVQDRDFPVADLMKAIKQYGDALLAHHNTVEMKKQSVLNDMTEFDIDRFHEGMESHHAAVPQEVAPSEKS
jgi:hypothetical protein